MRPLFLFVTALLAAAPLLLAGSSVVAQKAALSTVSPYATQIGVEVLRAGGNAIDAAVAIAFALQACHPQAGNIGGGGFLLYYEAKTGAIWCLDFRETAPQKASRTMFLEADGKPRAEASTVGPLAAGVPGSVAGLEEAHRKFGTVPWRDLLQPAIRLAREGFRTDAELTADLESAQKERKIDRFVATAARFYPGGKPLTPGSLLQQPDLAETLERIAEKGPSDFYEGVTAKKIVKTMVDLGGAIGYRDLTSYRPIWRAPLLIDDGLYQIYTMGPPSGGGLVMAETLAILSSWDLASLGFQTPKAVHLLAEAEKRAYIDRNKYIGDPASTHVPFRELVSEDRARQWRGSIDLERASPTAVLTEPGAAEGTHTTHFSAVDTQGNIVSLTTTLNDNFGSGLLVSGAGFFLNNAMDDFMTAPGRPNTYNLVQSEANAIAPGKRPASTMSPTIILRGGKPFMALGTRGGSTIPSSVLQVFLNVTVYHMALQEAVAARRFHHQGIPDEIVYEKGTGQGLLQPLTLMGHAVKQRSEPMGDIQALLFEDHRIQAVADPRHPGAAGGF
jgi:gamma-glutamyltranspeptidase/glutathione hydrolase